MHASAIAISAIVAVATLASWLIGDPHGDIVSPRLDPPEPEHALPGSANLQGR
jgi:hypothetical protein